MTYQSISSYVIAKVLRTNSAVRNTYLWFGRSAVVGLDSHYKRLILASTGTIDYSSSGLSRATFFVLDTTNFTYTAENQVKESLFFELDRLFCKY